MKMRICNCGSGRERFPTTDYRGIFCCYACESCEADRKASYRPEIFTGYTQADVDEPIEPED